MDESLLGRPRGVEDWRQIREICGLTADAGRPIEQSRRPFFAEYWIGPYQRLLPEWALVARRGGRVVGYLTGCPDTAAFAARRQIFFRLPLLALVLAGRHGCTLDTRRFLRRSFGLERTPGFSWGQAWEALKTYPAHLHVNVLEGERGGGLGRRLIEEFARRLAERGVFGIHLVCGKAPAGFYGRLGFKTLAAVHDPDLYLMGRRLSPA